MSIIKCKIVRGDSREAIETNLSIHRASNKILFFSEQIIHFERSNVVVGTKSGKVMKAVSQTLLKKTKILSPRG